RGREAAVREARREVVQRDRGSSRTAPARPAVGGVERDPVEPREELLRLVEGVDLAVEGQEGVLGGLFRVLAVAEDPVGQGVNPRVISLDHVSKGLIVAPFDPPDEIEVGGVRIVCHRKVRYRGRPWFGKWPRAAGAGTAESNLHIINMYG